MDDDLKTKIKAEIHENMRELCEIRTYLYENPEVGGEEKKAYACLTKTMENHGFELTPDFHGIEYCFKAVYDSGKAGATIGITCEFDALPRIGHGCGHNIIATATMGAAFGIQSILRETGGKVILFGTPGEECVCSKVQLTEEGAFDEVDVAMTIHPNPITQTSGKTTAIDSWQIDFYGKSAHAGAAPEEGINALDAAVHFYTLIGFEKQYLKNTNIYGVFVDGGDKCSVIPDHASVKYLVRAENVETIQRISDLFHRCADGASKAVGGTYKIWRNEPANKNMITNETMSNIFNRYCQELGEKEISYLDSTGSTDMGNVSHAVPTIHPWVGLNCPKLSLHSEEFAKQTITIEGDRAIKMGATALAFTALEILTSSECLDQIKNEFQQNVKAIVTSIDEKTGYNDK